MPRVEQRGRELWVVIPEDVAKALSLDQGDAVSFELLDKELAGLRKSSAVSSDELAVLKKLNEIKFAQRTKDTVRNALSDPEQKTLGRLVKKGAVQFYEGGKYKDNGVYSISRDHYSFLASGEKPAKSPLGQQKYLAIDSLDRAKDVLSKLENEVKNGEVVSVRGFDKKVYITTSDAVETVGAKITSALDKEKTLPEIVSACGEEEGLVRTVIEVLRESGDVIEKREGVYALA
ncbi:hypothetical protein ACFLQ2_03345 [archaeon]